MADAAVIIPLCANNDATAFASLTALRTCRASTSTPILAMVNNTPEERFLNLIRRNCELLNIRFHYVDGPFSISKCFNLGTDMTSGKYIAYGTADVIYYPNWLENIIDLWEDHPYYFALCNYSFDHDTGHPCARDTTNPIRKIKDTHNPSSGVLVLKRESNYVWDEQFQLWEIDADFQLYCEKFKLKCGYCMNSRADHMINSIRPHIDYNVHFGMKDAGQEFFTRPRRLLEAKWGLDKPQ